MTRRFPGHVLALALAVGLSACGGDGGPDCSKNPTAAGCTPTTTTIVAACAQTVAFEGTVTGLGSFVAATANVTTASVGRLDLTVDWTFASSAVAVYFVRPPCTIDQLNARSCDFVLRSEAATTPKPRKLSASNVAAGSYLLIVANAGSQNEAAAVQVVVSSPTCPAVATAGVGALRIPDAEWKALRNAN